MYILNLDKEKLLISFFPLKLFCLCVSRVLPYPNLKFKSMLYVVHFAKASETNS